MHNIRCRVLVALGLALALVSVTAAPALASPITDKQAQAAQVQRQVSDLNGQAEAASERYNLARSRYDRVTAQVGSAAAEIERLRSRQDTLQSRLNDRADVMYRQGPLGVLSLLLDAGSVDGLVATLHALTEISHRDAGIVAQLKETKAKAVVEHRKLVASQTEAAAQKSAMAASERLINERLSARTRLLAGLNADIRRLLAEQRAREEAAARALARAARARERAAAEAAAAADVGNSDNGGSGGSGGFPDIMGGNPPASDRGAKAVWWAMRALGRPYRWGAAGPNSFDCSGLMMWAYRRVGVSLPHHSGSQIGRGARVSRSNLQPGDLVFFGSPIHHVGMYVGGGDFIEAPYSGVDVRITPLSHRSDYAGACRP